MNETDAAPVPWICWEVDMAKNPSTAIHWREDITPGRTPVATLSHRRIVETTNKGGCPRGSTAAARSNDNGLRFSRFRRSARFQLLGRTAVTVSSLLVPHNRRAGRLVPHSPARRL